MRTTSRSKPKSTKAKRTTTKSLSKKTKGAASEVDEVVAALKRLGTKKTRDEMARYAIPSDNAFGVTVGQIRQMGKRLGPNPDLALALWETRWYVVSRLKTRGK